MIAPTQPLAQVPCVRDFDKTSLRARLAAPITSPLTLPNDNGRVHLMHIGQLVGDALVAIDTGLAFFQSGGMLGHGTPPLGGEIHGIEIMAITTLTRIRALHGTPHVLR